MNSNYNELYVNINHRNRSMHIENLERKFKIGTIITPDHLGTSLLQPSSWMLYQFIDCTVIDFSYYMGVWIRITVDHKEWSDDSKHEERFNKARYFIDHFNPITGKVEENPIRDNKIRTIDPKHYF